MRVMVKDVSILDLSKFFVLEYSLEARQAEALTLELKNRVFSGVAEYLGFSLDEKAPSPDETEVNWGDTKASPQTVRGSNFFFSTEDEEEVKELTKKLDNFSENSIVKKEEAAKVVTARVERIAEAIKINFSSQDLHKRLKQVLTTYVKGVRNRIDTKQTLLRKVDEGGLALNDPLANKVLDIAEKVINQSEENFLQPQDSPTPSDIKKDQNKEEKTLAVKAEPKPKQLVDAGNRDVPYDFATLKEEKKDVALSGELKKEVSAPAEPKKDIILPVKKKQGLKSDEPIAPSLKKEQKKKDINLDNLDFSVKDTPLSKSKINPKSFTEVNQTAPVDKSQDATLDLRGIHSKNTKTNESIVVKVPQTKEPVLDLKQKPSTQSVPSPTAITRSKSQPNGKVKMDDVKYIPKLTGPVDELKELSLEDFRRLGPEAEQRTKKIQDKVSFLEQDNYSQRLEGIKAWRQSPVNKLYLTMGQESITQNQSINAIIKNRMNSSQATLSQEEFNAVMELNKNLRF